MGLDSLKRDAAPGLRTLLNKLTKNLSNIASWNGANRIKIVHVGCVTLVLKVFYHV